MSVALCAGTVNEILVPLTFTGCGFGPNAPLLVTLAPATVTAFDVSAGAVNRNWTACVFAVGTTTVVLIGAPPLLLTTTLEPMPQAVTPVPPDTVPACSAPAPASDHSSSP